MRTTHLGSLATAALGLGCMGMSDYYGPTDWDESTATIHRALELGVTFLDTADIYGTGHNEVLVGRAIVGRRDEVVLATKFGIDRSGGDTNTRLRGDAAYVQRSCEASLLRLGVDHIDLYYHHAPSKEAEIEETVTAMAALVEQGKVRHLGLSNIGGSLLRRAVAVHPIAAVQSEYSLWSREIEPGLVPVMAELGVGLVPYSPLGRGFLTATIDPASLAPGDYRSRLTRFREAGNAAIAEKVQRVAEGHGASAAQVALAWVYAQQERLRVVTVAIPGTKRTRWLEQNVGALDVALTDADLAELDTIATDVVGAQYS